MNNLAERMKMYESVSKTKLMNRNPVIIRLDGKAFHTFTKGCRKPFDDIITKSMQAAMQYLCKNIMGCVLGYTQSDEITLVLLDYQTLESQAWYANEVQKLCSVASSMCTLAFNREFCELVKEYTVYTQRKPSKEVVELLNTYKSKIFSAMFDARCFSLPKEEVNNCLVWRQQDAIRNSIQSMARPKFTQKELNGVSSIDMIEFMRLRNLHWQDIPVGLQRGFCYLKGPERCVTKNELGTVWRQKWYLDENIPIFSEVPAYVNNIINN